MPGAGAPSCLRRQTSLPASAQRKGGNLRIARSSDADTLDPQKTTSFTSHETFTQIFDPLVMRDEKGNVLPHLALSWEFQNDNKRVVFKLLQKFKRVGRILPDNVGCYAPYAALVARKRPD